MYSKKRFISIIILALTIVSILTSCGSSEQSTSGTDREVILKVGHVYAENHPIHKGWEKFNERIQELSSGSISIDIHPNGILGSDSDMLEQLMMGQIDIYSNTAMNYMGKYPESMIEELPFLYESVEHWYAVNDGEFGKEYQKRVYDKEGLIALANWPIGYRHFTNNVRPIVKPSDMQGMKIRSAEAIIRLKMFEVLDVSAISMAFNELFTALQQGTVDGQENPLSTIDSASLQEVQDYLSLSGHIFTGNNVTMTKELWNSFTSEEQGWIEEAMDEATAYQRKVAEEEEIVLLEKMGKSMEINDVDYEAFREAVQPVYDFYIEEYGNADLIDMIEEARP